MRSVPQANLNQIEDMHFKTECTLANSDNASLNGGLSFTLEVARTAIPAVGPDPPLRTSSGDIGFMFDLYPLHPIAIKITTTISKAFS